MTRNLEKCAAFILSLTLAAAADGITLPAQEETGQKHATEIVSGLPADDYLRRLVIEGHVFGDGVERKFQLVMRGEGVKSAAVEVYLTWFHGPRRMQAVRIVYSRTYDMRGQITDPTKLAAIRRSGLEEQLKNEALRLAPSGHWVDLPHSSVVPFRAATSIVFWDDPWLPAIPHMFTTFGPGLPPLVAAVGYGDLADVDQLLAGGKIDRNAVNEALWYACSNTDTTILERLIRAGADVNQQKPKAEFGTCLMSAVWSGAPEAVTLLLASRAKVNGKQGLYNESPLTLAASRGVRADAIIESLVNAGADVNAVNDYGLTPLMKAANHKPESTTAIKSLINHGAQINARDHEGRTALWFAAEQGNIDAVRLLLSEHADATIADKRGRTASHVSTSREVVELIAGGGQNR